MVIKDFGFSVWFSSLPTRALLPTPALLGDATLSDGPGPSWPQQSPRSHQGLTRELHPGPPRLPNIANADSYGESRWDISGHSLLPFSSFVSLPSRTFWNRKTCPFISGPARNCLLSTRPSGASCLLPRRRSLYPEALDFHSLWLWFSHHKQRGWNVKTVVWK